jgi:hypothetical protein
MSFTAWVRRIGAGLSPRRSGFDYPSLSVRFVAYKMALGQIFVRVSPFSIVLSLLHTHLYLLHTFPTSRAAGGA